MARRQRQMCIRDSLNTGEEKIRGKNERYWVCTTEAMPANKTFEFLAVDEIQLCADSE